MPSVRRYQSELPSTFSPPVLQKMVTIEPFGTTRMIALPRFGALRSRSPPLAVTIPL